MSQPILMWFRRDLRVADNPALRAAVDAGTSVVAAFCLCPRTWAAHDDAPVKIEFWMRTLRELSNDLAARNIALRIIDTGDFAGVPEALSVLADEHDCAGLCFNREYALNEQSRDDAVAERFERDGRRVETFLERCIIDPGALRTGSGDIYSVYTPFRKAWIARVNAARELIEPLPAPKALDVMIGAPDDVPEAIDGMAASDVDPDRWPAGERAARERLEAFIDECVDDYHDERDIPGRDGTSAISPYLVCGAVSLRQCMHAVVEANEGRLDDGSRGAVVWLQELIWREFYLHVLAGFPRVCRHRAFVAWTEDVAWNENDEHAEAWRAGRTGVPIVDAGMRQLLTTGWMHNRVRMITAMFFAKNLRVDWRVGEQWFMQHLIDGDLAANNGGWQWSASTGTDAAPYFRIFNPWSQSSKFDPKGTYIRHYVPELADIADAALHDPEKLAAALDEDASYPAPIVDCKVTRAAAIDAFKSAREATSPSK